MSVAAEAGLHELAAYHVERLLAGVEANALAVSGKVFFNDVRLHAITDGDINQSHRFFFRASAGTSDAGYTYTIGAAATATDSICQGNGYFAAHSAFFFDQ